jgi:hypothetical protein
MTSDVAGIGDAVAFRFAFIDGVPRPHSLRTSRRRTRASFIKSIRAFAASVDRARQAEPFIGHFADTGGERRSGWIKVLGLTQQKRNAK